MFYFATGFRCYFCYHALFLRNTFDNRSLLSPLYRIDEFHHHKDSAMIDQIIGATVISRCKGYWWLDAGDIFQMPVTNIYVDKNYQSSFLITLYSRYSIFTYTFPCSIERTWRRIRQTTMWVWYGRNHLARWVSLARVSMGFYWFLWVSVDFHGYVTETDSWLSLFQSW